MESELLHTLSSVAGIANYAVGNDLVYMPDFKKSFTDLFRKKVYTADEITYCDRFDDAILRYASTWAAKEAVYKAVKQISQAAIGFKSIEIIRERIGGKPIVSIKDNNQFKISLSISHDGDYAWAVAIIELKR